MKIKLTAFIAAICMFITMISVTAAEEESFTELGFTYTVTDGKATITAAGIGIQGDVVFPDTLGGYPVTTIGQYIFSFRHPLTGITIPDSITTIEEGAFYGCNNLGEITIPESVTYIGDKAFYGCVKLTEVHIPEGVEWIGEDVLATCSSLAEITVDKDNKNYCAENGVLMNKEKTVIMQYPQKKTGTSYAIPGSVTTISNYAFYYCEELQNIYIPGNVNYIGKYAFSGCAGLSELRIPDSVTYLGESAISYCKNITEFAVPSKLTAIEGNTFGCCEALNNISLPEGITSIGDFAFTDCYALTEISIPKSVESIGLQAFAWGADITDVYYGGTKEDWEKIEINEDNPCLAGATIHYNSQPEKYCATTVIKTGATHTVKVSLYNVLAGCKVMVSGFNDNVMSDMEMKPYNNSDIELTLSDNIDEVKVMVWETGTMKPVCKAERVLSQEFAAE